MKAPLTQLGTLVDEVSTWNPSRNQQDKVFTYIDLGSIDQATKAVTDARKISCGDAPSRARQLVKVGDILVSTVRPNLNGVAKVSDGLGDATASTGFCVLRPQKDRLDSSYLFHWVRTRSFVDAMVKQATGASYPAVSDKIIFSSKLPLPPLPKQRRIAAILDKADTLRAQRRATIAKLDELLQSVFIQMFGDPVTNPKGFPRKKLGEIIKFEGGAQPPASTFSNENSAERIRLVQIRDFKTDKFITYIPRSMAKRFFEKDDVMIGRYGPPVFQIFRGLSGSYNVALMKAVPRDGITSDFIFRLLQERNLHKFVVANSERTAGQSGVNLDLLEAYEAYFPPWDLQQRFANISKKIECQRSAMLLAAEKSETLFTSLQQLAFSGKL